MRYSQIWLLLDKPFPRKIPSYPGYVRKENGLTYLYVSPPLADTQVSILLVCHIRHGAHWHVVGYLQQCIHVREHHRTLAIRHIQS